MKRNNQELMEQEQIVRSMISREDDLINHRMSWLTALNGFLFAALGFSWDKANVKLFLILFSILGLIISSLNAGGIFGSGAAQRRLLLWWRNKKPSFYDSPGVMGIEPVDKNAIWLYFNQWFFIAIAFALAWLFILVYILSFL
jgi:hypothetical protein